MDWFIVALTLPGFMAAYFMFVRPMLAAIPSFKTFYAEADTFWTIFQTIADHLNLRYEWQREGEQVTISLTNDDVK